MSRREYPTSKLKDLKPEKAWAAVSYDTPPEVWEVAWYRENLPDYLRHVRVMVTPILRKPAKRKAIKR